MAARLEVQISASGAAYEENPQEEAAQALERIARAIRDDVTGEHNLKDSNGNTVGSWEFNPDRDGDEGE